MAKSVAVSETPASTVAAQHGRVPAEIAAPPSFANLVEGVSPAVVTIEVDRQEKMQAPDAMRDFPFGGMAQPRGNGRANPTPAPRSRAAGSGFIIDSDGYIVTNNHVVELARKITVHLADKRELDAKLVGTDVDTDVALLKVEARNLRTVKFGNDLRLRVGDWAVAVGNPFSLGGTVTAGIVSSMGRDIGNGPYTDYIQLDAPINQGNSGGPAFDISGQVIGMNTAIYSPSGGSVGIGFAIPATTIRTVVDQLKTQGSVQRGWLGVEIHNFTPDIAASLGVQDAKGALVAGVTSDSPAPRAGFRQGDAIVELNGTRIEDSRDLSREANLRIGQRANFTVLREGTKRSLTATIEKRDGDRMAKRTTGGYRYVTRASTNADQSGHPPEISIGKVTGVAVTAVAPEAKPRTKACSRRCHFQRKRQSGPRTFGSNFILNDDVAVLLELIAAHQIGAVDRTGFGIGRHHLDAIVRLRIYQIERNIVGLERADMAPVKQTGPWIAIGLACR